MAFSEQDKGRVRESDPAAGQGRGREAEQPHEVPPAGWLDILSRTAKQISADNLSIVSAGVAFYAFLSLVPALAAIIGVYGLVSDPAQVSEQISSFARVLPQEILPILEDQLKRITSNTNTAGLSAIIGVLLAIYSSTKATNAMIQGLNIAYGEKEKRGFLKLTAVSLVLTFGIIIGAVVALALVAVLPAVLKSLNLGTQLETIVNWSRWPLLMLGFVTALSVLYRYAPSRENARWAWVSWGATLATVLWVGASALFSVYVSKFGSYDKTYGSLGAIVVFLLWLYLSAFVVLIGAELNSEMERQTVKDTTDPSPKPLGQRGAVSADTVGPSRHSRTEDKDKARPPAKPRRGDAEGEG